MRKVYCLPAINLHVHWHWFCIHGLKKIGQLAESRIRKCPCLWCIDEGVQTIQGIQTDSIQDPKNVCPCCVGRA